MTDTYQEGIHQTYRQLIERGFSCGHPVPPFEEVFPGEGRCNYARVRTEADEEGQICVQCAFEREKADLLTHDRICQYFSSDKLSITGFLGNHLMRVTYRYKGRHNIGGYLWRLNATDVHGRLWYGTSPGPGMYCRMRKRKAKG